jgi:archaemetzincin
MKFNTLLLISLISILLAFIPYNHQKAKKKIDKIKPDSLLVVGMDFQNKELMRSIGNNITSYYHLPVAYQEIKMPKTAFSPYGRNRYDGNIIISELKKMNKDRYHFIVGLTDQDICTQKKGIKDYGIFGLGSLDNSGCISSTKRLKKNVSAAKLQERLTKVVLHEIGHNMGLNHCNSPQPCFMKDAGGKLSTVDKEPMELCARCKKQLLKNK